MEDYIPIDKSDPLSEDSLFEKIVWWGLIHITYAVFIAALLVAIIG
jgi:hypothetical protein